MAKSEAGLSWGTVRGLLEVSPLLFPTKHMLETAIVSIKRYKKVVSFFVLCLAHFIGALET